MKLYSMSINDNDGDGHLFYEYFPSKKKAESALVAQKKLNRRGVIKPISVTPTKTGILKALNLFGHHADNG